MLIKVQDLALNFLVRWFLLDELDLETSRKRQSITTDRNHHHQSPQQQLTCSCRGRRRPRDVRLRAFVGDLKRLDQDKRRDWRIIAKCIFWRWFTVVNSIELILMITLMGCCVYQCYELLDEYYTYPTHIIVENVMNDNFRVDLPGLTICSNNRVSKATLKKNFAHLNETHFLAISQGTFFSVDNFTLSDRVDPQTEQAREWLHFESVPLHELAQSQPEEMPQSNMRSEIDWPRVMRYLTKNKPSRMYDTLPADSIIDSLLCANINGDQIACQNLARVHSVQQRSHCETLFHDSALWDSRDPNVQELERNIARKPINLQFGVDEYENVEFLEFDPEQERRESLETDIEEQQNEDRLRLEMDNMEVIRLRVNFGADDYANPRSLVGARLAIHASSRLGEITHMVYKLEPGNWYTYYIDRSDYRRLPPPYSTACYEYDLNRNTWRDRARWLYTARDHIYELIKSQAHSEEPLQEYVEILRLRSLSKVSVASSFVESFLYFSSTIILRKAHGISPLTLKR